MLTLDLSFDLLVLDIVGLIRPIKGPAIKAGEGMFPGAVGKGRRGTSSYSLFLSNHPGIRTGCGIHPSRLLPTHPSPPSSGPTTPIQGLYCCGDSTFPGIGLPAVAASGVICANTLVSVDQHIRLLEEIGI